MEATKEQYICNYHFVSEAHDITPNPENTECSGLSQEDAENGHACKNWCMKMNSSKTLNK